MFCLIWDRKEQVSSQSLSIDIPIKKAGRYSKLIGFKQVFLKFSVDISYFPSHYRCTVACLPEKGIGLCSLIKNTDHSLLVYLLPREEEISVGDAKASGPSWRLS